MTYMFGIKIVYPRGIHPSQACKLLVPERDKAFKFELEVLTLMRAKPFPGLPALVHHDEGSADGSLQRRVLVTTPVLSDPGE